MVEHGFPTTLKILSIAMQSWNIRHTEGTWHKFLYGCTIGGFSRRAQLCKEVTNENFIYKETEIKDDFYKEIEIKND
jgi:hypothetical protein